MQLPPTAAPRTVGEQDRINVMGVELGLATSLAAILLGIAMTESADAFRELFASPRRAFAYFTVASLAILPAATAVASGLYTMYRELVSNTLGYTLTPRQIWQALPFRRVVLLLAVYCSGFVLYPIIKGAPVPPEASLGLGTIVAWIASTVAMFIDWPAFKVPIR